MNARAPLTSALEAERLRASPNFVLAFSQDGKPYVAQETEPYLQYWLTQRYRILFRVSHGQSPRCFSSTNRGGAESFQ